MLQRAASNAYSWWWASHIRTKQSKWLEQNLQDMDEKVQGVLKLIQEDGDSFAKRAEMYYKKRPELISFVEDSYRAYRALADRYDHMSTELQNANNTIAYVFPEQVQFAMEEEEEEPSPRLPKKLSEGSKENIPKVPKIPKELKGFISSATKKFQSKKPTKIAAGPTATKSGMSKSEGLQEIDKLQKQILALQTEKEFVKSSYESGLAKYWEIDHEIREMQDKVCTLQDEFGAGIVIEDDEARTLMASVALKSCQDTLAQLQEKQERSAKETAVASRRIEYAREKLKSLKDEFVHGETNGENSQTNNEPSKAIEELKSLDRVVISGNPETQDSEVLSEKIKEQFDVGSALTVNELAEKIDELVNKVISLEASVSSQTALIQRLRSEADELQAQIRTLEEDKSALIDGKKDLSEKLRGMEDKLHALQNLNQSIETHNSNLQIHFTKAQANLDHPPEKLHSVWPEVECQIRQLLEVGSLAISKPTFELKGQEHATEPDYELGELPENEAEVTSLTEVGSAAKLKSQVKLTGQEGATKPDLSLKQQLDKEPEEEIEVTGKSHEELKGQEDTPKHNGSFREMPNMKQEKETGVSDFQQRVDKSPKETYVSDFQQTVDKSSSEVGMLVEVKEREEKPGQSVKIEHDPSMSKNIKKRNASQDTTKDTSHGSLETLLNLKMEGKYGEDTSSRTMDNSLIVEMKEQETNQEDEPDWKQMFMNGMENREKVLLTEYTSILRNFKEAKKKLEEIENKGEKSLFDATLQLRELKSANAKKDEEIKNLCQKLSLLQAGLGEENEPEKSTVTESPMTDKYASVDLQELLMGQTEKTSEIEEKFRANIDAVLEENLDFWLRFSSIFQQIQKFETEVKDLQSESSKLEEKLKKQDGSSTPKYSLKSDAKPLYKHLREIHTELTVWIEKSTELKDELKSRFSSLCDIQEEITIALKDSAEDDDFRFTSYQAAKFQGEILNMKQENNKVADELQAGLDHVTKLQLEVERSLAKLNEIFKLSGSNNRPNIQLQHSESRSRVPLRSFIFGVKPKKQRTSIFSLHPALQKKYHGKRSTPKTN